MVGLTNDERCLIHNMRMDKHCVAAAPVAGKKYENVFKLMSTLNCE